MIEIRSQGFSYRRIISEHLEDSGYDYGNPMTAI